MVRHLCQTSPSMCNSCLKFSQTYYERVCSIKKTYLSGPGEPQDFSNIRKKRCPGVVCVSYVPNRPIWSPGQHLALYFSVFGIPGGCLGRYLGPIWCAGDHLGSYFLCIWDPWGRICDPWGEHGDIYEKPMFSLGKTPKTETCLSKEREARFML